MNNLFSFYEIAPKWFNAATPTCVAATSAEQRLPDNARIPQGRRKVWAREPLLRTVVENCERRKKTAKCKRSLSRRQRNCQDLVTKGLTVLSEFASSRFALACLRSAAENGKRRRASIQGEHPC
jgi:hypothetical protein